MRSRGTGSRSVRAFVQARMSSTRFPGKVLAPFRGEPIIMHVVRAMKEVLESEYVIVVTSTELSDDPLALYLEARSVQVFRDSLHNVFGRFRKCATAFPCDWILRICADSPLLMPSLIEEVLRFKEDRNVDLVTTRLPMPMPSGQNAELIRAETFMKIDETDLTAYDIEHVTPYFYRNKAQFRIIGVSSTTEISDNVGLAVDTVEDLQRLEKLSEADLQNMVRRRERS